MQNVQNAAEIQQRVINLVELYRTKVGKESQAAKKLAEDYNYQYNREINCAFELHEQGFEYYILDIDIPEEAVDAIRTNEQLLGYFYKKVAGDNADEEVTTHLLADKYDSSVFTSEEEQFLVSHFTEMVNYIILTPNNDLSAIGGEDRNDLYLLPTEVLALIKERVVIPSGSKIYNPFSGLAQLACLYKDCSFFCEESYQSYFKRWNAYCDELHEKQHVIKDKYNEYHVPAIMKVVLYANSLDAKVIDGIAPQTYDAVISYIPFIPKSIPNYSYCLVGDESSDAEIIKKIQLSYQNLKEGGKMVLILPTEYLWKRKSLASVEKVSFELELEPLWKQLIADNSLLEVIQLPAVMGKSHNSNDFCVVIAEKGHDGIDATLIDARFASVKSEDKLFNLSLDLDSLHAMMDNGGKEPRTGLRKMDQFPMLFISSDLLVPQVYVVETPSGAMPVFLADICTVETSHIYDVQFDLPKDTPCIGEKDLSATYTGPIDTTLLKKANCPNNPQNWRFGTKKLSRLAYASIGSDISLEDLQISWYRNCWYMDGSKDAVLFKFTKDGIATALIKASGKAIAVSPDIYVLYPKTDIDISALYPNSIDALSLLSLINLPLVYRQMEAYQGFGLYAHLHDILVPTEECIIVDGKSVLLNEEKAYKQQLEIIKAQKTEYINEVRMRKHDMGQYIFELMNIEDLMRYYLDNRETEKDFCQQIGSLLDNFRSSLKELSSLLDNLSKEEHFCEPDHDFDINYYLLHLSDRHKSEGYKITYVCDRDSIEGYNLQKQLENAQVNPDDPIYDIIEKDYYGNIANRIQLNRRDGIHKAVFEKRNEAIDIPLLNLSHDDFVRLVNNILDNARKHGFTDSSRKDYEVIVILSIDLDKDMYRIDFRNNGNPLPEGMNKMRYGIKGEKAGKTAGTGIGGSYVKKFVEHYGGDYDVFMEDDWTVVRIYLPIK